MAHSTLPRGTLWRLWFMPFITCVLGTNAHAVRAADASSTPDSATAHALASEDQGASEGPKSSGILLGGGLGGAIPSGEVSDGVRFGDLVRAFMLGRLDAGYRFNEHFLFGAYVEGGTGAINTSDALAICDADGVACSAGLVRLGVQARAYLSTQSRIQPWGGAGFGYEWFSFSARDEEYDDSVTVLAKGAELLRLTLGLDFWATERNLVSVLVGYALGTYGEVTYTDSVDGSTDLDGRTHHSVTMLATYNFMLSTR